MTHIKRIVEMVKQQEPRVNEMKINSTSDMDVLKYICENLQNNIKVAKALYSVQQKDGRYKAYDEFVKINGIVFNEGLYWLLLEDESRYQFNLIIEELNNGHKLNELLVV